MVSCCDVGEGGVAVNCEKTVFPEHPVCEYVCVCCVDPPSLSVINMGRGKDSANPI